MAPENHPSSVVSTPTLKKHRLAIKPSKDGSGNRTSSAAGGSGGGTSYKDSCELIDLSAYTGIRMDDECSNDSSPLMVICQAKVTMEELVRFTMQRQLIPKVVAEFRNITVGGAISGAALESTSHKYGQFMDIVAWVKARTGSGEVVTAKRGDPLWCSLSGTYGSLGIVLEAALECVPAKPSIQVSYYAFDTVEHGITTLSNAVAEKRHVFLDGLIFPTQQVPLQGIELQNAANRKGMVVMQGEMIGSFDDDRLLSRNRGWKSRIHGGSFYYEHVRDLLIERNRKSKSTSFTQTTRHSSRDPFFQEVILMEDYLFRYDYGAFWMARPMAFELPKLPSYFPFIIGLFLASYRWMRVLTGSMFTTKKLFQMLKRAPEAVVAKRMVVQDCYIPPAFVNSFLSWVHASIPISTPIWLCPVLSNDNQPFTPSYVKPQMQGMSPSPTVMINCGIYGRVSDGRGALYTQQLESMCNKVGGRKMLYAQNHYSERFFWDVFDKADYQKRRHSHHATDAFPSLYEKTCGVPEPQNTLTEAVVSLFL